MSYTLDEIAEQVWDAYEAINNGALDRKNRVSWSEQKEQGVEVDTAICWAVARRIVKIVTRDD